MSQQLSGVATYQVCGVEISALTPPQTTDLIVQHAVAGRSLEVHLCNAYTLSLVDSDPVLRNALTSADLNLPDGTPVAWLGRRRGTHGPVRGPQLVGDVHRAGVHAGVRHYLYGAGPGVAAAMAEQLKQHAPGVEIVGVESPPFGDISAEQLAGLAARIEETGANIVWVGLGTPRQDYLVPRLAAHVNAVLVPVGAAFDFWAGTVKQAPKFLHGSGLEWLYRLAVEPRRLWRRYLVGNPRFVVSALRGRLSAWRREH